MCQIYEDRFLFEEGVCRWHMTDEKRNIDHKDIQIVQVIFNDYLASEMCVLKDFNCIFAEFGMSAERYDVRDDK